MCHATIAKPAEWFRRCLALNLTRCPLRRVHADAGEISPNATRKRASLRNVCANRWRLRISSCNRCPTPARRGGTWRTRRGFLRRSCLPVGRRTIGRPTRTSRFSSIPTTTVSARPFPRARRGLLTRPTVAEVFEYRHAVDERMARLLHSLERRRLAGNGKRRRTGNQPRTTASRADAHRHQARLFVQSALADVSAIAGLPFARRSPSRAAGPPLTGVSWRSGTRAARLPSTTSDRVTRRFCSHLKFKIGSRPQVNFSSS